MANLRNRPRVVPSRAKENTREITNPGVVPVLFLNESDTFLSTGDKYPIHQIIWKSMDLSYSMTLI